MIRFDFLFWCIPLILFPGGMPYSPRLIMICDIHTVITRKRYSSSKISQKTNPSLLNKSVGAASGGIGTAAEEGTVEAAVEEDITPAAKALVDTDHPEEVAAAVTEEDPAASEVQPESSTRPKQPIWMSLEVSRLSMNYFIFTN